MTEDEMVGWYHQLDMSLGKLRELVMEAWRAVVHGVAKSRTGLSDRTELNRPGGLNNRSLFWRLEV